MQASGPVSSVSMRALNMLWDPNLSAPQDPSQRGPQGRTLWAAGATNVEGVSGSKTLNITLPPVAAGRIEPSGAENLHLVVDMYVVQPAPSNQAAIQLVAGSNAVLSLGEPYDLDDGVAIAWRDDVETLGGMVVRR